jgi:transcriptional regulator with GAF, ATPase, and Fis domain
MPPRDHEVTSFEALLADLAGQLLSTPLEAFDARVTEALSGLIDFLEVERAQIALTDPADGLMRTTHSAAARGIVPFPVGTSEASFPWVVGRVRETRRPLVLSGPEALPAEAAIDRQGMLALAVKSVAVFPLAAGDRLLGLFSFGSTRVARDWPRPLLDRLGLTGQVLASAFLRREQASAARATLAELEALRQRLQEENEYLRERAIAAEGFEDIVGESPALRNVLFQVEQVAPTDATVLLLGETGTGKEMLARAIHAKSARRGNPLVPVNCGALPLTLIESELFGHERGAFTGAVSRKIGRFELAHRSSLFLDEIGELPLAVQAKLLRVLQEGEFERVGSSVTQKVDVRVIAASNRDLAAAVREGTFRADLYYRLRVFPVELPPLRARKEDIPVLVWHCLAQLGHAIGKRIDRVPAAVMDRLIRYDWPGNIRELRNVLERAVILSAGPVLALSELDESRPTSAPAPIDAGGARTLEDVEREHILRVLAACGGRVRGRDNAAAVLGLNASTLYSRMKKLGIRATGTPPILAPPLRSPGSGGVRSAPSAPEPQVRNPGSEDGAGGSARGPEGRMR